MYGWPSEPRLSMQLTMFCFIISNVIGVSLLCRLIISFPFKSVQRRAVIDSPGISRKVMGTCSKDVHELRRLPTTLQA